MTVQPAPQPKTKLRRLTWRRVVGVLAVGLVLAGAAFVYLLGHLETPWLRARLVAAVHGQTHLDVAYAQAGVGWHGVVLRDVVVMSPQQDRPTAPELLHVDRLELGWQPADVLAGRGKRLTLAIAGVTAHVVVDEHGETSLQRLLALLPPSPEKPPTPLSRLLEPLRTAPAIDVQRLAVDGVRLRLTRKLRGDDQHVFLGDLALHGTVQTGPAAQVDLHVTGQHLQLETTDVPLPVETTQILAALEPLADGSGVLPLTLGLDAQVKQDRLAVRGQLASGTQVLVALDANVVPQPQAQALAVQGLSLRLADYAVVQADVTVDDAMTVLRGDVSVRGKWPEVNVAGLRVAPGRVTLAGHALRLTTDVQHATAERLTLDLDVPDVAIPQVRAQGIQVRMTAGLAAGLRVDGAADLSVATLTALDPAAELTATAVSMHAGCQTLPDAITLTVDMTADRLDADLGHGERRMTGRKVQGHVALDLGTLAALQADPLAALRRLTLQTRLAEIDVAAQGERVHAVGLDLHALVPPVAQDPAGAWTLKDTLQAGVTLDRLDLPHGVTLTTDLHYDVTARELHVDPQHPLAATGTLQAHLGTPVHLSADVTKAVDDVRWAVDLAPDVPKLLALLQPSQSVRSLVAWDKLRLTLHSSGTASQLAGMPRVTQASVLDLRQIVLPRRADVPRLLVNLDSKGQGLGQVAQFKLEADVARVGPVRPGGKLLVRGDLAHDSDARRLHLGLNAQGPHALVAALDVEGHAVGADLAYTVHADVQRAAAFLHALPVADRGALCLLNPQLSVLADARGVVAGGARVFAQQVPGLTVGKHHGALTVQAVRCQLPAGSVEIAKLVADADADLTASHVTATVQAGLEGVNAAFSGHALHLDGFHQRLRVVRDAGGLVRLEGAGSVATLAQDFWPGLPVRDATWQGTGWSGPTGARLDSFTLTNAASGTQLTVHGGLDRAALRPAKVTDADLTGAGATEPGPDVQDGAEPVPGRLGLNLALELTQDLPGLLQGQRQWTARGKIKVPVVIESGDLVVFRTSARLHFDHVDVAAPDAGLAVDDIVGDVPADEVVALLPELQILGGGEEDAYARWRFAEHQPFLRRSDFLSIAKVRYGGAEIGPIAGNASIDRDVFRMDQLEAALLHGQLTGQCVVLLNGEDTHVQLRGNATGLQAAGSPERFDASVALDFLPARRSLDGRAEVLHIGRPHLEALLNLWDPYGEDTQSNRLRTILRIGHPQRVRLKFAHGFLDVAVELGGLTGAVQIDELRGIAMGPVFQRWLDPLLEPLKSLRVREAPKP